MRKFLKFSERVGVRFSDADITDNVALQRYTKIFYNTLSYVVEYGGDHTAPVPVNEELTLAYPFLADDYAFKVCRIEPENNIHMVLEAYSVIKDKTLVIVGNWNNSDYGQELKKRYTGYQAFTLKI